MLLQSLTDEQIVSRVHQLTRRERATTLLALLHLNEIERRKLHLSLGYSSMFAFCTSGLGYSESDAGRRIQAARCIARFPEVYALLESNAVTIVTISRVASILSPENKNDLLARVCGRMQGEVDAIVAEYRPHAAAPRDRVQSIAVQASPPPKSPPLLMPAVGTPRVDVATPCAAVTDDPCEKSDYSHDGSAGGELKKVRDAVLIEKRVKFSFTVGERFKARFDRIRSLAAHRLPANASCEDVFGLLMDQFLEREDPTKRHERREKRTPGTQLPASARVAGAASVNPRHIPVSIRDEVFQRNDGRCAFIGRNGRRCGSTHALQVDHIHPVALGGEGTIENLRLLCAQHNRFEAERLLSNAGIGTVSRNSVKHRL